MSRELRLLLCLPALLLNATTVLAQDYSYDGKRWFEVEVTVFTNTLEPGSNAEIPVPDKAHLAYLPRLLKLQSPSSTFMVNFPADEPATPSPVSSNAFPFVAEQVAAPPPVGPVYSPAVKNSFRIADFTRDAFIDLTRRDAKFTALDRNLENSSDHRVLWHSVWLQSLQTKNQTSAVYVSGGNNYGEHAEVEGSLRLSQNDNAAMLDINLWLNRFAPGNSGDGISSNVWVLPHNPLPADSLSGNSLSGNFLSESAENTGNSPAWSVQEVWEQEQSRELGPGQLYYLDHPAFGVLIEIRPYVLPLRATEEQADFP